MEMVKYIMLRMVVSGNDLYHLEYSGSGGSFDSDFASATEQVANIGSGSDITSISFGKSLAVALIRMVSWIWLSQQETTASRGSPNEIYDMKVQIIWELLLTEVQITLGFYQVLDRL